MRKYLLYLLLSISAIVLFFACRKTELQPEVQKEIAKQNKQYERFFTVPASAPAQAKAVAEAIKKQNEKYGFLSSVIKSSGYPVWEKTKVVTPGLGLTSGRTAADSAYEVVYVPFVLDSGKRTNAVLSVKMGASDSTYRLLPLNRYWLLGYDTSDHAKWNARSAFTLFATFDNSVFGYTKFFIKDTALFKASNDSLRIVATLKNMNGQSVTGRTASWWSILFSLCENNNDAPQPALR